MSNNAILGGHLNSINYSTNCTVINGANNYISGANNVHVIGDNVITLGANAEGGSADNDDKFYVGLINGMVVDGPVHCRGNIECEADIIAFSTSDERLKDNIKNIPNCLQKVLSLDAIEFDWNEDLQKTYKGRDIGLIAQQVQEVAPEIVEKRNNGYLGLKYEKMIPLLVGATQEQDEIISELEKQVDQLMDQVNHL
jgi:hypothetical protein